MMTRIKDLKNKVIRNKDLIIGAAILTAATAAAVTVIVVVAKILNAPTPSIVTNRMNDAIAIDLSDLEQITKLHEMIDNCKAADVISFTEGAMLFLEK